MIPGAFHSRLLHQPQRPLKVRTSWTQTERTERCYVVEYLEGPPRALWIDIEAAFPHEITGWQEKTPGLDGITLTTVATRKKSLMLDYWRRHNISDRDLRNQLGLSTGGP